MNTLSRITSLALDAAKEQLRSSGNDQPTDVQAAVVLINEISSRFPKDVLKNVVFGEQREQFH